MRKRLIALLASLLVLCLLPLGAQAAVSFNDLRVTLATKTVRAGTIKTDLKGTSFGDAVEPKAKIQGSGSSINYEIYFGDNAPIVFKGSGKAYEVPANTDGSTYGYWISTKVDAVSSTQEKYYFEWHEHDKMTSDENGHFVECEGCSTPKGGV